jgi:putative ABC transport system permease protein
VAALSATSGAVPVAATPAAAQLIGTTPVSLGEAGSSVTIRLAGQIDGAPGVAGNAVVVAPLRALGHQAPPPNLLLVAGPRLDAARLTAVVRGGLPGGSVSLRSTALSAMTTAPVLQAARAALTQAMDAAAGFGALILLLLLLLTARSREMTLAYLATMGLRRWQAQLLLAIETLPPVVAAAIGGVACAWLLVPLIGPSLNLAAFSGTGSAIVVTPAVAPLVASAAGLMLAALLVLAAQAVLTYQRGSTRALRIAD